MILDLFEEVCGARLTYSYITIGGVHDDLPEGWIDRCQKFLDYFFVSNESRNASTSTTRS